MRNLSRREFLRLCGVASAGIGLAQLIRPEILEAFAPGQPPVVWLQGGSCSGCSISLLNSVDPDISAALTKVISLKFHQTLMAATGDLAMNILPEVRANYAGEYYLVVEGTVPLGSGGQYATLGENNDKAIVFEKWVREMAKDAKAVMAVGACAAFGGIPAAKPNPTNSQPVSVVIGNKPLVNVAGCPVHPDWVLGTLVHLIKYGVPDLDEWKRPKMFFGHCVHDFCERREAFNKGHFAKKLSARGCLYKLGCKGPMAYADCPTRKFNNGVNWCVGASSPCIACTQPTFPDHSSPFFQQIKEYGPDGTPTPQVKVNKIIGGEF